MVIIMLCENSHEFKYEEIEYYLQFIESRVAEIDLNCNMELQELFVQVWMYVSIMNDENYQTMGQMVEDYNQSLSRILEFIYLNHNSQVDITNALQYFNNVLIVDEPTTIKILESGLLQSLSITLETTNISYI